MNGITGRTGTLGAAEAGSARHGGRLLLIVDVQHDFCEGGALGVDGGSAVAARIRDHAQSHLGEYSAIAISQDWHSPDGDNGGHFSDAPDFQDSWPVHCVAGSPGAALRPEIEEVVAALETAASPSSIAPRLIRLRKGYGEAAYSALEGVTGNPASGDPGRPFADLLEAEGWAGADVSGLALDFCVAASARGMRAAGLPVRVLRDLTAAVHPASAERLCAELEDEGITITTAEGAGR